MKKKLLYVVTTPFSVNSALLSHVKYLSEYYDICLCTNLHVGELKKDIYDCCVVRHIDIERKISIICDVKALMQIIIIITKFSPDAVHSLTPKAGLLAMTAGFLKRVPFRFHTFTGQVWANAQGSWRIFLKLFDKIIALLATNIFTDSHSQCDFLRKEKIIGHKNISVLGEGSIAGVDLNRFFPSTEIKKAVREQNLISIEDIVFNFVGRLAHDKGIFDLIDAFKIVNNQHKNTRLIIVGPDDDNILPLLMERSSEIAHRILWVGNSSVPENYNQAADILVLPSYREGFSTVIIEAAACGVPAIGYAVNGINDPIVDGETGILVEKGNVQELAKTMLNLSIDKAEIKKLGNNARVRVEQSFKDIFVSESWLAMYKKSVGG